LFALKPMFIFLDWWGQGRTRDEEGLRIHWESDILGVIDGLRALKFGGGKSVTCVYMFSALNPTLYISAQFFFMIIIISAGGAMIFSSKPAVVLTYMYAKLKKSLYIVSSPIKA